MWYVGAWLDCVCVILQTQNETIPILLFETSYFAWARYIKTQQDRLCARIVGPPLVDGKQRKQPAVVRETLPPKVLINSQESACLYGTLGMAPWDMVLYCYMALDILPYMNPRTNRVTVCFPDLERTFLLILTWGVAVAIGRHGICPKNWYL